MAQLASMPLRVLVAEDFLPFRRLMWSTMERSPKLHVISQVADGLEAVQKAVELRPDLILLDIGLPTLNGIEAARQIHRLSPESKIVFVSQDSDPEIVQSALGLGACGYVAKATAASDLLVAIERVSEGGSSLVDCWSQLFQ